MQGPLVQQARAYTEHVSILIERHCNFREVRMDPVFPNGVILQSASSPISRARVFNKGPVPSQGHM